MPPLKKRKVKVQITLSNKTELNGELVVTGNDRLSDRLNKITEVFKTELIVLSTGTDNYININKQHIVKVLEIADPTYKSSYFPKPSVKHLGVKITLSNGETVQGNLLLKGEGKVSERLNKIFGMDFIVFLDSDKQYYMLNKQHIITVEEMD